MSAIRFWMGRSAHGVNLRWVVAGAMLAASWLSAAQAAEVRLTVSAGTQARKQTPVSVALSAEQAAALGNGATGDAMLLGDDGMAVACQITQGDLSTKEAAVAPLTVRFVLPELAAGASKSFLLSTPKEKKAAFAWSSAEGAGGKPASMDLTLDGKNVLRYMCASLDETNADTRSATFKPYHHVFDLQGKQLLTKGPGGKFPHHRGLFFGFNRISYDGGKKQADTWHCNKGEFQSHEGVLASSVGSLVGGQVLAIDWHGQSKDVFAKEKRQLQVTRHPRGTVIDFTSHLRSEVGKVKLDGDPQHAGFQFRATQEVPDKTADKTFYVRPDGKGEPGKFRNWPDVKTHVNLPWNALSFVLGEQRYTVAMLDRPENPKESRFSERDYGRFGSYFEYEMDTDKPLVLNYRVVIVEGEMGVDEINALHADFVAPPAVTVSVK